jgi:glycosyltransferase involved in cell wall biosynthesis
VAVVIPAYNPGPFIDEALASVVAQTFDDWEAVVVDDGSAEDLQRVSDVDPRIRLVSRSNAGPSVARNAGIIHTHGDYVAFLDADDVWLPEKLERQVAAMDRRPDGVLCSTRYEIMGSHEVFGVRVESVQDLLRGNLVGCLTVMVRREAFAAAGLFDPRYPAAQDWDMWIRLARVGPLLHLPEVLARYRVHPGSISRGCHARRGFSVAVR